VTSPFTDSDVEQAALAWLEGVGWQVAHGPDIAPDVPAAERADYGDVAAPPPRGAVLLSRRARRRPLLRARRRPLLIVS
jgi:hypothetical protein